MQHQIYFGHCIYSYSIFIIDTEENVELEDCNFKLKILKRADCVNRTGACPTPVPQACLALMNPFIHVTCCFDNCLDATNRTDQSFYNSKPYLSICKEKE